MAIPPQLFWPYAAGAGALGVGTACRARSFRGTRVTDRWVLAAPILAAIGLAVFGADHLTAPSAVEAIVPVWMPWRLFWAVFVGIALEAAAISLSTGVLLEASTRLLGMMLLCFALMIFFPIWMRHPAERTFLILFVRDLTLGWCFIAYSARHRIAGYVITGRYVVALGIAIYGILLWLHPESAPGIPADGPNAPGMPGFFPAPHAWTYLSGTLFLAGALGLIVPAWARRAAKGVGLVVVAWVVLIYLPVTLQRARDVENGLNYLAIHSLLAGALLLLSESLPEEAG